MADRPGGSSSAVWAHFKLNKDVGKAICNTCSAEISISSGSTSGMIRHLSRKHAINATARNHPASATGKNQTTIESSLRVPMDTKSQRYRDISEMIMRYVVVDMQPLSAIEDQGFRDLMAFLEPRYQMMSRKHLSNTVIPSKYAEVRTKLAATLKRAWSVALTTDAWTSITGEDYVTVTAHAIHEWELDAYVLETKPFDDAHTADNLAAHLLDVCQQWGLSPNTVHITTDNASNIVKGTLLNIAFELSNQNFVFATLVTLMCFLQQ